MMWMRREGKRMRGKELREIRTVTFRLSQAKLGFWLGVSDETIWRWENGDEELKAPVAMAIVWLVANQEEVGAIAKVKLPAKKRGKKVVKSKVNLPGDEIL